MDGWPKILWQAASVLLCLLSIGSALPTHDHHQDYRPISLAHPFAEFGMAGSKRADKSLELRILSLGASIMSGTGSSNGNGCRKFLRDALRLDGWPVNMVGSLTKGTSKRLPEPISSFCLQFILSYLFLDVSLTQLATPVKDKDHEAVPGDVLTQVLARVPNSTGFKPNIVIINAGTNDANTPVDPANAGSRLNNILNALWKADGMSKTCLIVSTLIPTTNANGAANQDSINDQYRALVKQRAGEGKCIYMADMWPKGEQWFDFSKDYLAGETPAVHPNDGGHAKMAAVYYNAINQALDDNRVVEPGEFTTGSSVCPKYGGEGKDAGGLTQRGSGYSDGIYYHDSVESGVLFTADSDWDRGQWKFARLFDRRYDDLVAWINKTSTSQVYAVWANSGDGKGKFTQVSDLVPDLNCQYTDGVNFIDMNADGLDDLVYIDADGNAYLSINQGDGNRAAGKPPTFKRVSSTALIKKTEGKKRDHVVLADIDGDGRGDYGVLDDAGNAFFWRNGWINDIPKYWQYLGKRFEGKNKGDLRGTQFEDINGDGRDDWVWLDDVGRGDIYTNGRSCATGKEGNGLNVAWRAGFKKGESSGPAFKGMGSYVTKDEKYLRNRIHFARIFGQSTVFGNLPKQDYVFMQHTKLNGKHRFQMRVWKNAGAGGTKLLADGNKYCNMMGHDNGMVDYVWAYQGGKMEMWANRGKGTITESDPDGYWNYKGTIWTPPQEMDRRDLHLADWDGDGACDIIYANPKGGAVQVWINNYPKTGKWDWTHQGNPAPALSCSQTRGLGLYDLAVRFADITGNGRADYLCIEPGSRTTGFIHNDDGSWTNAGQIKVSIDKDRANLRWADVNGDGREDLLWVEKFSGDAYVYYNHGPSDPDTTLGSSFAWAKQDSVAYAGNAQGSCEFWADIDGNGRADEDFILGTFNNKARTALAPSCGLRDNTGDDGETSNVLPSVPGAGTGGGSGGGGSNGGGSGDGDGLVLVPPVVWADPHPTVGCVPPCTLIWPPLPIAPTTVSWPPVTTSIWSVVGGVTRTVTTVITVNPFVVSKVPFWPVVIGSGDPTNGVLTPVQSVIPPLVTVPLSSDQASIKTTTSDNTTTILPPVWAPGRHTGSFQPMPTVSVTLPPGPVTNPTTTTTAGFHTVSYTRTHPTTTCTADCGSRDCGLFGCIGGGTSCGLFGCLGGCGLFGCDGLCGVSGCTPDLGGGGGGGGDGGDPNECQGDDCGCDDSKKVTSCGVLCTHTVDQTTTRTGECSTTTCITTSCGTDTTRTSTTTTTEEDDVAITEVARDTFWSEDASADFASTVKTEIVTEIETAVVTVRPTATKTVTKETSKKTTTTKEASAPKPSRQVQIVHTLFITKCFGEPGCSNKRTYNWLVYATDYGEGVNFCRDQDSIYAASTNDVLDSSKPFPKKDVGKFDIKKFDLKNCKYTAKSATEVGTMVCDGLTSIKCEPANDAGKMYECDGITATEGGVWCYW
ncbi:fg-gap repeat domain-containing [Fusarium albosuccineum]|uniref:Fg-gap repeat domain-containing n=1 Tax=Fusarium albosuccineum TaxID=1237068 RepID=A0A8H4LK38_9HYPO|nr:fg-gap repeat domain-containing [Fusarium albosuccineum]